MKRSLLVMVLCALGGTHEGAAQVTEWKISVGLRGSYTTTSKIFNNPEAPTADARSQHFAIDNVYGGGLDVRIRHRDDDFFFVLSVEYLSKVQDQIQLSGLSNPPRRLPVKDGFRLIPLEVGGYVHIPLGSETIRLAMGGGLGAYIGERILSVVGVEAVKESAPVAFGIHVESMADYRVFPGVSLHAQMRFRDPEIVTVSRYSERSVQFEGGTLIFPQESFKTKINVDGIGFGLGVVVDLF